MGKRKTLAFNPMEKIVEVAEALGVSAINTLPTPWTVSLDSVWTFAVNGTGIQHVCEPRGCAPTQLASNQVAIWYDGIVCAKFFPSAIDGLVSDEALERLPQFAATVDWFIKRRHK